MANSPSGETVIQRVDRVLGAFTSTTRRLTAAQVAKRADLPTSTAHRLCGDLVRCGWLDREGDMFVVGTRLWELSTRSAPESSLAAVATPFMQDAQKALGQHIHLGRPDGREVLFVQRLSERGARDISSAVAERLPLHVSAVGLVLLAWMEDSERASYLAELSRSGARPPQGSMENLEAVLQTARAAGHVIQTGNIEHDRTAIAVPVKGPRGSVVAALGVVLDRSSGPVDPATTVQVLRTAAHGIERTIRREPGAAEPSGTLTFR